MLRPRRLNSHTHTQQRGRCCCRWRFWAPVTFVFAASAAVVVWLLLLCKSKSRSLAFVFLLFYLLLAHLFYLVFFSPPFSCRFLFCCFCLSYLFFVCARLLFLFHFLNHSCFCLFILSLSLILLSAAATTTKGNNNYCAVLVISETQQIWYMYTHTYIIYRHTYRQAHTHTQSHACLRIALYSACHKFSAAYASLTDLSQLEV